MRRSPLRHSLAVLRTTIGLTQKQLAKLVNRATRTIQAVELGILPLSESLAMEIARQTGVDAGWLLENDPTDPPRKGFVETGALSKDTRYSRDDFEYHRAVLERKVSDKEVWERVSKQIDQPPPPVELKIPLVTQEHGRVLAADLDQQLVEGLRQLLKATLGRRSDPLVRWKVRRLLETVAEENSIKLELEAFPEGYVDELLAKRRTPPTPPTPPAPPATEN